MNKEKLSQEQIIQEEQYSFPYHHIPQGINEDFSLHRELIWGYEYISYLEYIINLLRKMPFNSLLDAGCGDGKFIHEAAKLFPNTEFHGIDYSKHSIEFAQAFTPKSKFFHGDINDKKILPQKYEIITSIETLEHIPPEEISSFIKAIRSHITDNGKFIVTVPSKNSPLNKKHYQHFDLDMLKNYLSPYFIIESHLYINSISSMEWLVRRLLINKFYVLNHKGFKKLIYRFYKKHLFFSSSTRGRRILITAVPNN